MKKILGIFILISFFLNSCNKENQFDCFKSTGKEVSEIRDLPSFNQITLENQINLNISQGANFNVEVIAGKNIIKNILTKVKNGILTIENNNKCNFVRGYKRVITVNVTVPFIKLVQNNGVGVMTFDKNFHQDTISIKAESSGDIILNGTYNEIISSSHGNGDIYLNGICNTLFVYSNGTNYLHAENLTAKDYLFVETLSIGDCYVNLNSCQKFDYNIWSDGNIYYKGSAVSFHSVGEGRGKGKAIQKN